MELFSLKPDLYFGANALDALREMEGRSVLVVTDRFLVSSGLLDRILARLPASKVTVFDQVTPDPSLELVAQGVQLLRQCQPEAIIAFGGGSPMDCAKAVRHFSGACIPLWAVPTTAGTGSEMTSFAVLTDKAKGIKHPLVDDALLPEAAVLDPSLLAGIPPAVTADTGIDVLSHAVEAYVATGANSFADALAEKAFVLAYRSLPGAYRTAGESSEKESMLYASCLAGMAFNAAGLGICHSLAHALGGRIHLPHGRLNGILMPHVIAFNARDSFTAKRYARLAKLCGLAESSRALSAAWNRLLTTLKLPKTLLVEDPAAIAETALADHCTRTNPVQPSREQLIAVLKELSQ